MQKGGYIQHLNDTRKHRRKKYFFTNLKCRFRGKSLYKALLFTIFPVFFLTLCFLFVDSGSIAIDLKNSLHGHPHVQNDITSKQIRKVIRKPLYPLDKYIHVVPAGLCDGLISGDPKYQKLALRTYGLNSYKLSPDQSIIDSADDCNYFVQMRSYNVKPASVEEASFPIAFSIVMYERVEQAEILLRSIYRPQNYYCIHVDLKSSLKTLEAMEAIAKCFDNVFLAKNRVNVQWGKFGVLEADLICLRQLYNAGKWRYFINLTGQEFPLKTNAEIVSILRAYNGAADVGFKKGSSNK